MLLSSGAITLNKQGFVRFLSRIDRQTRLRSIRTGVTALRNLLAYPHEDGRGILSSCPDEEAVSLHKDVLLSELDQILEAKTIERANYYVKRLEKGIERVKTGKINDINLSRWKEYSEILTDSLWVMDKRDSSGAHLASYWGNFIPQIPHQMMMRYTKKGDWVLDAFAGGGTTLIECRRLGRNGIGIELLPKVAREARNLIEKEGNPHGVISDLRTGDSRSLNLWPILLDHSQEQVQLLIMHPPYHDIIKFSNNGRDLSNAPTTEDFLKEFGEVVENAGSFLEKDRYLVLVIGDKYSKGDWIPLGFHCMNEILKRGYTLKSIVVKNFEDTRGKRAQKELWRYRALVGGFYVFKHEYVMVFRKTGCSAARMGGKRRPL
ncbi:MAG: DNA methyltransferase [Armatimonadetes bacterium]|nr:DNA methyltransferase [Armatimonadota bacterium]